MQCDCNNIKTYAHLIHRYYLDPNKYFHRFNFRIAHDKGKRNDDYTKMRNVKFIAREVMLKYAPIIK